MSAFKAHRYYRQSYTEQFFSSPTIKGQLIIINRQEENMAEQNSTEAHYEDFNLRERPMYDHLLIRQNTNTSRQQHSLSIPPAVFL